MATGYEVQMYRNINEIAKALEQIAEQLALIREELQAKSTEKP
jgi:hypothetical protein